MRRWGLNILSQTVGDRAALIVYLQRLKPDWSLVMDEWPFALQVLSALPAIKLVYRAYNPQDHEYYAKITPAQFIEMHRPFAHPRVWVQCHNEPGGGEVADRPAMVNFNAWMTEALVMARGIGLKLAAPNFAVGCPHETHIRDGVFDSTIRQMAAQALPVFLHEYGWQNPAIEPYLVQRHKEWLNRFRALGLPVPEVVISETGRDENGGYLDGYQAVMSSERYGNDFLPQVDQVDGDTKVSRLVFGVGRGGNNAKGQPMWEKFNIENDEVVKNSLVRMNDARDKGDKPVFDMKAFQAHDWGVPQANQTARTNGVTYLVRTLPSQTGTEVGRVGPNDRVLTVWKNPFASGGFNWRKVVIRTAQGNSVQGYTAVPEFVPSESASVPVEDVQAILETVKTLEMLLASLRVKIEDALK